MSQIQDTRGFIRRFMLIHAVLWVLLMLLLTAVFFHRANWHRSWVLLPALVPPLLAAPSFIRFRRAAIAIGYPGGKAFREYLLGVSLNEIREILEKQRQRQVDWDTLAQRARVEEPQLSERIAALRKQDNLEGAMAVYDRAKRDRLKAEQEEEARFQALRQQAEALHCTKAVWPLLVAKDLGGAGRLLSECQALLARARVLDVYEEAVMLIEILDEPDFSKINQLLKDAQDMRALKRLEDELKLRIGEAPPHDQPQLLELLGRLVQLPFGSRDFRKSQHELETALGQALGTS